MLGISDALNDLGHHDEAEPWYHRALEAGADGGRVHYGLAVAYQRRQRHAEAVMLFEKALEVGGPDAKVLSAAAQSLQALGRYGEAAEKYQAILDADPDQPAALLDTARLLLGLGQSAEAVVFLEHLLSRPGGHEAAWPLLLYGRMALCDWHDFDDLVARVVELSERELAAGGAVSVAPFSLFALPVSEELRSRVADRAATIAARSAVSQAGGRAFAPRVGPRPRLTIGYLSPDFAAHSVGTALKGVLHDHDRQGFRVVGYGLMPPAANDEIGDELRQGLDDFRDLSALSDAAAAAIVADDGVDILVDLAGHTRGARLGILALRPAPLQAHFLGYGKSLGGGLVDYLISDAVYWPPEVRPEGGESVACLPHQSLPALAPRRAELAARRGDFGLPDEGFVFANFHTPHKHDPRMFGLWMGILERVPGSVLWLLASEAAAANLRAEAERRGLVAERLVFATRVPHAVHLARHELADLMLDTRLHGGGVTTIEALWCGVAVLTLGVPGADRAGASLLAAAGLDELICPSLEDYLEKAVALAGDGAALAAVRQKIAAGRQTSPLFDTLKFCHHLEAAYRGMWEIALAGEAPRDFEVPA